MDKDLKKKLNPEQIKQWEQWQEKWKGKKWCNERFDEGLEIVHPGYKRVGEVVGGYKKVLVRCKRGHEFVVTPSSALYYGSGCKTCFNQGRIRDVKEVFESIKKKTGYLMDIEGYMGIRKPAKFKCPYGYVFEGTPGNVERGRKKCPCDICRKSRKRPSKYKTKEEIIGSLKEKGFILYHEEYKGIMIKTRMWCVEGKHWTEQRPNNILYNNCGCSICSRNRKKTLDEIDEYLKKQGERLSQKDFVYENAFTKLPIICPKGHVYEMNWNNYRSGYRCPQCKAEKISGENNPNYNPNKTDEEREKGRITQEYDKTREASFERDNYTCRITGQRGRSLVHHHLDGYNWCMERRYDLNNVITLSEEIHNDFHNKFGKGNNTRDQFIEYLNLLVKENRFPERKQHILALIDWIEETRDKMDFNHLEGIKQIAG